MHEKHRMFEKEPSLVCEWSGREIVEDRTGNAGLENILKNLDIMPNSVA